jgi:hypothetical protein
MQFSRGRCDTLRRTFVSECVVAIAFSAGCLLPSSFDLFAADGARNDVEQSQEAPKENRKLRPKVTVSQETTRLLEPLDSEGYVDYFAALNRRESEGVTHDNNAVVLFVCALRLEGDLIYREGFFQLLGIEPLPEHGDYLSDYLLFFKNKQGRAADRKDEEAFFRAMQAPWSPAEFPTLVEWLQSNEKPLALIVEGTLRPKCYFPLVPATGAQTMISTPLTLVQETRAAGRALAARAMLRLHEGQIQQASDDLLACHRLGRMVANTPFIIAALVGSAVEGMACQGDAALLEHGKLSAEDALVYQAELRKLPPLPVMADVIDISERYMVLDAVTSIARHGRSAFEESLDIGNATGLAKTVEELITNSLLVNWDEALRVQNEHFDKTVAALRQPSFSERARALHDLEQEVIHFRTDVTDPLKLAGSFFEGQTPRKTMGRKVGKLLASLLLPAMTASREVENRARTRADLGQLGFALAAWRAEHDAYPDTFNELAPKYIPAVPVDLYSEQPLHYAPTKDRQGYLLYSIGANLTDEGGLTFDSQPPGDDIPLEIPRPSRIDE